jgi:hypothetical protein
MADELRDMFQQLVADPPPPSNGVPSDAVFTRIRTVRRRRTAGVAVLAAAAVAAVALAAGNITDLNSTPPISGTPGPRTVVTGPPTTPTSTSPASSTTGAGIGATATLKPHLVGRTLTMQVIVAGTVLVPRADGVNLPPDTSFLNLSMGTEYSYGDGVMGGSDGGALLCTGTKKRATGQETYSLLEPPHKYAKAGVYTFAYRVTYCGVNGWFPVTQTAKIVVP